MISYGSLAANAVLGVLRQGGHPREEEAPQKPEGGREPPTSAQVSPQDPPIVSFPSILENIIMLRRFVAFLAILALTVGFPKALDAQGAQEFLAVGDPAPDVEVMGATRHGVLMDPVKLSDYRGETVVLAFFFRARSGG